MGIYGSSRGMVARPFRDATRKTYGVTMWITSSLDVADPVAEACPLAWGRSCAHPAIAPVHPFSPAGPALDTSSTDDRAPHLARIWGWPPDGGGFRARVGGVPPYDHRPGSWCGGSRRVRVLLPPAHVGRGRGLSCDYRIETDLKGVRWRWARARCSWRWRSLHPPAPTEADRSSSRA